MAPNGAYSRWALSLACRDSKAKRKFFSTSPAYDLLQKVRPVSRSFHEIRPSQDSRRGHAVGHDHPEEHTPDAGPRRLGRSR